MVAPGLGDVALTGEGDDSLESLARRLHRFAIDRVTGVVTGAECRPENLQAKLALGTARIPIHDFVRGRKPQIEWTAGVAESAEQAQTLAALEALERYASARPRGLPLEFASADDLGDLALDPRKLVLHSPEQYRIPGFPYEPFDPGRRRYWTWAYSVHEQRHVAVPADLVFYRLDRASPPGEPAVRPLAQSTSSGCAIRCTPAGAALHGLLETLERDAFLVAWHRRRPLPQLDLERASEPRTRELVALLHTAGYRCVAFDTTLADTGVPSVWVVAVNMVSKGLQTLSGACSHPVAERAVLGATTEVAGHLRPMQVLYESRQRWARRAVGDPRLVRHPLDHALLYGRAETLGRLDCLLGDGHAHGVRERFAGSESLFGTEARDWIGSLCSHLTRAGFDVLFADLTPPDLRALGLSVVRALVPGLLPITFGHGRERLSGTERLGENERAPWPHPLG